MTAPLENSLQADEDPSMSSLPPVRARLGAFARLMRLDRPIGTYLLLWPTLWALLVAGRGTPPNSVVVVFVLGSILMRAAGCVINDYADRKIHGHVARTRQRPLATGEVTPREALVLFAILIALAASLLLLLNWMTFWLALVAVGLATLYPFTKRHTHLPQVVLGAAFGWATPMAFAAVTSTLPPEAWLMYVATILLTVMYDTEYAMVDRPDDLKIGVKSTAVLFGDLDRIAIGTLQGLFVLALLLLGPRAELIWAYYLCIPIVIGLFVYQQRLIAERAPADCLRAFLNNHWVGVAVLVGIGAGYWIEL